MQKYHRILLCAHWCVLWLFISMGLGARDKPIARRVQDYTQPGKRLSVVYHPKYNISFFGLHHLVSLHAFDGMKYKHIYDDLQKEPGIAFCSPARPVSDKQLQLVHTPEYLQELKHSRVIARIVELPFLQLVPNFLLQHALITPFRWATAGSLLALEHALHAGFSINLGGGYHHAHADHGEGFCVFSDIALLIREFHQQYPHKKVLIVDLDAHQGNGHESLCGSDDRVAIYDIYNQDVYPQAVLQMAFIDYHYPLHHRQQNLDDDVYLTLLKNTLPSALDEQQPDLVVYVAGSDILQADPLGRFAVSEQGILQRDAFVASCVKERGIPTVMLLAGGYTKESAGVVARSIKNLAGLL